MAHLASSSGIGYDDDDDDDPDWDDRGFSRSRRSNLEREAADIFRSQLPQADAELLDKLWADRFKWKKKKVNVKEWLLKYGLQQTETRSGLCQFDAFSQGALGDSINTEKLQKLAVGCVAIAPIPHRAISTPGPAATGFCAS